MCLNELKKAIGVGFRVLSKRVMVSVVNFLLFQSYLDYLKVN